jgi:hypothetical protein
MIYFEKKSMDIDRELGEQTGFELPPLQASESVPLEKALSTPDAAREQHAIALQKAEAIRVSRSGKDMPDPLLVRIDTLLSEGLRDEYTALSQDEKQAFKKEGDALAAWLHDAVGSGRVKSHDVLTRIERWLLIIEGRNRAAPWLLQEAFIRARRVLNEFMSNDVGH